jgi:hypothetical protein
MAVLRLNQGTFKALSVSIKALTSDKNVPQPSSVYF